MTGIRFPRHADLCTRVPVELRLETHETKYEAKFHVKWSEEDAEQKESCDNADVKVEELNKRLASSITDASSLVDEIEKSISEVQSEIIAVKKKKFSASVITITAFSPDLPNLTLIDLPGVVAHSGGDSSGRAMVENLCMPYFRDESTVLMAVFDGSYHYDNQPIWNLIKEHDPNFERTIGVITKADLITNANEKLWLDLISGTNTAMALKNGWYVTKSLEDDSQSISQSEALEQEMKCFSEKFWRDFSFRSHLGTENLRTKMTKLLLERMRVSLPELKDEVEQSLLENNKILKSLGEDVPASDDEKLSRLKEKVDEMMADLRSQFGHNSFSHPHNGTKTFYAVVQRMWEEFKYSIREAGPKIKDVWWTKLSSNSWDSLSSDYDGIGVRFDNADAVEREDVYAELDSGIRIPCFSKCSITFDEKEKSLETVFSFLIPLSMREKNMEGVKFICPGDPKIKWRYEVTVEPNPKYRERVKDQLRNEFENRRLMIGERSTEVTPALCNEFIAEWIEPSHDLADKIHEQQIELVNKLAKDRFQQFSVLQTAVCRHARNYLNVLKKDLLYLIDSLHSGEMNLKHTLNDHYFYETKMRYNVKEPTEEQMLQKARELTGNSDLNQLTDAMRKHLLAVGLEPENPFEKHIDDAIATVAAYHKCAYKRYVECCHIFSAKVFFDDFLKTMKENLWKDVRKGSSLDRLFSEDRDKAIKRQNAVESIAALNKVLAVLNETELAF